MALGYAFIDEQGRRHGEDNPEAPHGTFEYVPETGRFAGQRLVIHVFSWEGGVSGTRLVSGERFYCYATDVVEELLGMDDEANMSRLGDR
jgi:hypothetical protein